jgi:hypothetical protein
MEAELKTLDRELMINVSSPDIADIFKRYEEVRKRLNEEMNNWAIYSHEVDEFLKQTEENGISKA